MCCELVSKIKNLIMNANFEIRFRAYIFCASQIILLVVVHLTSGAGLVFHILENA